MNPPTPSPGTDYSTRDVAQILGLAVRSVQLMVDRGELSAWKTAGGHRRISRASVEAFLQRRQDGGAPERRVAEAPAAPAVAAPASGRVKVLLIEDSKHYQKLASMLLRSEFPAFELHVADDGFAGLAMAGQLQPALLIVDILLPGMDGATLITSLRSHLQFAESRLIVMTSLEEQDLEPYLFALQGVPIVHKPRIVSELPHQIRAVMGPAGAGAL
jgi:excisionase family DNA binding protein